MAMKWRKPRSAAGIVRILAKARDLLLSKFRVVLDHACPYTIKWDEGDEIDPGILILWDIITNEDVKWSEEFGAIGFVCKVHEKTADGWQLIGGVQIGAAVTDVASGAECKTYETAKTTLTIGGKKSTVVIVYTTIDYFLSAYCLKANSSFVRDMPRLRQTAKASDLYNVTRADWERVISLICERARPSKEWIERQRQLELDRIKKD